MDFLSFFSIVAQLLLYIGALFASGTVSYLILFEINQARSSFNARRITVLFAVLGLVAALISYALAGARLTGEISGAFDPEMLGILWKAQPGKILSFRVLGFSLIIIGLFSGKARLVLVTVGCFFTLESFVQIGHVAEVGNLFVPFVLLIHLIGIAIWVGILLPLYRLSLHPAQIVATEEIARRFGQLAMAFVPVLLIAGGWLAYQLVHSFSNLFATGYGQALLIKVAMVTGLLSLAAANKLRFVPALQAGDLSALKSFNYSVVVEMILMVFIMTTTAILTTMLTLPETHA